MSNSQPPAEQVVSKPRSPGELTERQKPLKKRLNNIPESETTTREDGFCFSQKRNIKLTIAYDGTEYCGWQIQNNEVTVQGTIEKALSVIHKKEIKLTGSGRTDSGVHAKGQVANFHTHLKSIPEENFSLALNSLLPRDIRIMKSEEVDNAFHSRYDARERIYRYYISSGNTPFPWQNNYCHYVRDSLDIKKLNKIVSPLTGIHDFTTFSAPMEEGVSMTREIYSASFYSEYPYIVFKISGKRFSPQNGALHNRHCP